MLCGVVPSTNTSTLNATSTTTTTNMHAGYDMNSYNSNARAPDLHVSAGLCERHRLKACYLCSRNQQQNAGNSNSNWSTGVTPLQFDVRQSASHPLLHAPLAAYNTGSPGKNQVTYLSQFVASWFLRTCRKWKASIGSRRPHISLTFFSMLYIIMSE